MTTVFVASDHAGFEYKNKIILNLKSSTQFEFIDLGPNNLDSVDYPDFANLVCEKIKKTPDSFGILICGSGQGMALRANKYPHIRAALVYNSDIAKLSREHNNANVICLGSRFCTLADAENWISLFLKTPFSEGRHAVRVDKISAKISC